MKLKRLKIKHFEQNGRIVIGKPKLDLVNFFGLIIFPLVTGITLLILFGGNIIEFEIGRGKIIATLIFLFGTAIFNFTRMGSKWGNNSSTKTLVNNSIKIKDENLEITFNSENVKELKPEITEIKEDFYEGTLNLIDLNDQKHIILGFDDENEQYLLNDLNWFVDFFSKYLKIKQ
ncbi:hypothetical protein [Polaribacter sp. Asnod6-C07]|uniref:hypothetical protein n=1 Tax=Polaribacter sp. Asnod6-C07 TaxID=3160582 RepID=UPI0038630F7A